MARQKTKSIPFANEATEVERGVWEWTIRDRTWRWKDNAGMNLFFVMDGKEVPVIFTKNLNDAAMFTEGFGTGFDVAKQ